MESTKPKTAWIRFFDVCLCLTESRKNYLRRKQTKNKTIELIKVMASCILFAPILYVYVLK